MSSTPETDYEARYRLYLDADKDTWGHLLVRLADFVRVYKQRMLNAGYTEAQIRAIEEKVERERLEWGRLG